MTKIRLLYIHNIGTGMAGCAATYAGQDRGEWSSPAFPAPPSSCRLIRMR